MWKDNGENVSWKSQLIPALTAFNQLQHALWLYWSICRVQTKMTETYQLWGLWHQQIKMCLKYDIVGFKLKLFNVAFNKKNWQALSGAELSSPPFLSCFEMLPWAHDHTKHKIWQQIYCLTACSCFGIRGPFMLVCACGIFLQCHHIFGCSQRFICWNWLIQVADAPGFPHDTFTANGVRKTNRT